jgi:hypothetical protein
MAYIHKYKTKHGDFFQISGQSSPVSEVVTIDPKMHEKSIPASRGRLPSVLKALEEAFAGKEEPVEEKAPKKKATLSSVLRSLVEKAQ